MVKNFLFALVALTVLSSCLSKTASDKSNSEIIEIKEGDLTLFNKIWDIGDKNIDTVIFINATVGARASMTFINRKGEYLTFGENISNINFINNQTFSGEESFRNKTFVITFRNLVMKGADSPEFAGDRELNLITGAIQLSQDLEFKELKSKYKFVEGRFNNYSMGDLAHYDFTLRNGESFDFGGCKDEYYDFEYDSESLTGKNFLIFYENVQIMDPDNGPYTSSIIHHLIPIDKVNKEKNSSKMIFNIPPPSGPGTGVCNVSLTIDSKYIIANQTCGGHNENGHIESTEELFNVPFVKNRKYKVSKLFDTSNGSSFGCEYFEIKENKLYLYDEKMKLVNDWFCIYGNTLQDYSNRETCDCIFSPSKN